MTTDLPEQLPDWRMCGDHAEATYPEIRAYGIACWNAAIEAAARECNAHAEFMLKVERRAVLTACEAIRALTKGE